MRRRRIALRISLLVLIVGVAGWLVWGGVAFGFTALFGVLGLAITFLFLGGLGSMYGPVRHP